MSRCALQCLPVSLHKPAVGQQISSPKVFEGERVRTTYQNVIDATLNDHHIIRGNLVLAQESAQYLQIHRALQIFTCPNIADQSMRHMGNYCLLQKPTQPIGPQPLRDDGPKKGHDLGKNG